MCLLGRLHIAAARWRGSSDAPGHAVVKFIMVLSALRVKRPHLDGRLRLRTDQRVARSLGTTSTDLCCWI